jgi:predicted permease
VSFGQARAEVSAIGKELRRRYGSAMTAVDFTLVPAQRFLARNARENLLLFGGAVVLLLLVACANVSNLSLAQFLMRRREFAVREALGASKWRLARQLVIENLLMTAPAAALGALLARAGVATLLRLDQGNLPRVNAITVNGRVLMFACGLALAIAIVLGLAPALRFRRRKSSADPAGGLKEGGFAGGTRMRLRGALVVVQIALTLALLTSAGLLGRSFLKVWRTDPGFKPENAVSMTLALPSTITPEEDEQLRQFYSQLLDRTGQSPGVVAVGGVNALPLTGSGANGTFRLDGDPSFRGEANYRVASAGYFAAMGIPLLRGRIFDRVDTKDSPHVAVISRSLAARYWPNEDPIGKRIQFGSMDTDKRVLNVVGVVGDVRVNGLENEAGPTVYAFSLQRPQWWQVSRLSIVARSSIPPQALIPAMRASVTALKADVPLSFKTLEQVFSSSLDPRRFSLAIFGSVAVVALLIGAVGVYSVMSYLITQRTREIGIRMALGARPSDALRIALGQGMRLAATGVGVGALVSLSVTRLMKSLLFHVEANDPLTLAAVSLILTLVALLACWAPARRAARVNPMVALRRE